MSHFDHGPLATYNSLTDTHLAGYFANTRTRRHLIRAGLVSKNGVVVSETTYRLNMSRKEHKKHVKDMLAQAIVHKTLDLERSRQAEIKKKLEEIAKIQLVRRVRASRARKGDEDILPLLTLKKSRPYSSPTSKPRQTSPKSKHRPYSAPGVRADSRLSQTSTEEDEDVLYLDDEGRPINSTSHRELGSGDHVDTRHLYALDTTALRRYAMMMSQMEQGGGHTSPYLMAQVPLPPRLSLSGRSPRSARRLKSVSPQRPVGADGNIARLHRSESAKMHEGQQQSMCKVAMRYHGWELHLAREQMDPAQEIQVEQQHCGGNTLTVFKERLVPGSEFSFISYRHRGYPFSLTLYIDGHVDSRVSTCCEARHACGAKIGGKQGHFSLVRVEGAVPCYKCQVAKGVMIRSKAPRKQTKRPPQHHVEEVVVVSSTKDSSDKDKSAVNRSRETQDEEKPVKVAVERDDDNQQDDTAKESKKDNYEDDFEPSGSSSLSSSSSDSESESEGTARKDRDEEGSGTSGSRGKDVHPLNTQHRAQSASPPPSPRQRENEKTREVHSPNQPKTRDAPRTRYRDVSAGDKSPGRVDVNGTGRQIDDFSSDEDGNDDDKKATILSMDKVEAEEEKSPKRSSRSFRSSSQSSSSSSSSSRSGDGSEEEKNSPTVVSVQHLDGEEVTEQRVFDARRSRDQSGQKAEERSQQWSGQHQGLERQHHREQQERQQQEKAREMEELRRAEELRRQREKFEQQKREEASRRVEEERRAEAQRNTEGGAECRRQEEGQRRQDSVTSSDDQSKEDARQKAQRQRELEILEGQRLREEKWRAEKQAREEAWKREEAKREQELRGVEKKREEGFSSARSTPTSSSPAKSVSVTSESDADSSPQRTAGAPGPPADGRHEQQRSAASPSTQPTSQTEKRKPKGKEEGKEEEEEEETSGEKSQSVGRTPVNFLETDDQASTAPASSRTAGSSRSSGQDSASSDSSSTDSSSSDSESESESDNNGSAHTAKEKENVSAHTAKEKENVSAHTPKETDRYGNTRREEVEIRERQRPHTGAAAGGEEQLPPEQVGGVDAAPAARKEREARERAAEDNNDIPAARLSPPAKVPPSPEPEETREALADTADSSSSSSDSMTSLSGRSSSRASSQQQGDEGAPSDVLESNRQLGRVPDDREHTDEEHVSARPARATADHAAPTAHDDAGRMLQPPPAPAEERPSSFSSLDEDVWKLGLDREGPPKPVNSEEEFLIDGEQPVLHDETEISGDGRLQETTDSPGSMSLEISVREHLLGEESVELPNISLSKAQVREVASHLAGADKVSAINLRNTRLHDEDVEKLSASIAASPSEPEMLNLSLNSLTEKSVRHLLNVLKAKPSVKLLLLPGNQLGDEGVGQLVSGLQDIQREARAQRKFASDSADTMSVDSSASTATTDQNLVPRKYILRDLDLASTGITDAGAARVGELLAANVAVEALRLSANEGVTPEVGWARIGEGLSKNRCLRSLALDGNRLGDAGVKQLAGGLHTNRMLTSLKLQHAGIGEEGGRAIMEMLKRNTTIQDLTLTPGNAIPEALMGDINKYVALNRASGPGVPKR